MFLDDMFDSFLESEEHKMKCDIYEKDNAYNLEMDVPGFNKDEINIEYNKGTLTISAEKKEEKEDKEDKKFIRRERFYGKLSRSFYLGDIEEENIKAEFKDGTLRVIAPKKDENISKKVINID
jgi:HSP20 family protein